MALQKSLQADRILLETLCLLANFGGDQLTSNDLSSKADCMFLCMSLFGWMAVFRRWYGCSVLYNVVFY